MGISIEDMNKIKRAMLFIFIFGMNTLSLLADNGGRGRLDNDGPSDFAVVLFAIFAIVGFEVGFGSTNTPCSATLS